MADIFTPRVRFYLALFTLVASTACAGFFVSKVAELDRRYELEDRV